jgi:glutathione S-transferase
MRQPCDKTLVAEMLAVKVPPLFDYLEKEIGSRQLLVGDAFSIADIAIATMIANFVHAGERVDQARWPQLARYAGAVLARPTFKATRSARSSNACARLEVLGFALDVA